MIKLCWKTLRSGSKVLGALILIGGVWPLASTAAGQEADALPGVSIDDLLKLPVSFKVETSQRGGATRAEWHARFITARADASEARDALEKALDEMGDLAEQSGNWKVASPIGNGNAGNSGDSEEPLNYGLKQKIRRKRVAVDRTENTLVDLTLEANLASVPETWYEGR
jgi:hypothetical protein